jgi:opacity protein-like surface antigen
VILAPPKGSPLRFALVLLTLALRTSAAQVGVEERPIQVGLQLGVEPSFSVEGPIAYFRGTEPRPTYIESVGSGSGLAATLGYRFGKAFQLSLTYERTGHGGEREQELIDQTMHQVQAVARVNLHPAASGFVPYLSAGVAARVIDDSESSAWPATRRIWGSALTAGGGAQFFLTPEVALDASAEVVYGRFDHAELPNEIRKELGTDRSASTRLRVGVSMYPKVRALPAPLAAEQPLIQPGVVLRAYAGTQSVAGTVLTVSRDTMIVQVRAPLQQVAVLLPCLTRVDLHRGRENLGGSAFRSAVEGAVVIGALAIVLRPLRGANGPGEAGPFMRQVVLPGALVGGAIGLTRSRDRWERATPVGWESPWRQGAQGRCGPVP